MKKIFAAIMTAALAVTLGGCKSSKSGIENYNFAEMSMEFIQLQAPKPGDTIAIIDTDYGEIRIKLFEEYAPNTTQAFINLANEGKYDDIPVMVVYSDTLFLSGGYSVGENTYVGRENKEELIANEYTPELWPFKGALMSYSDVEGFGDARWFVCNNDKENLTKEAIDELKLENEYYYDEEAKPKISELLDKFYEYGGVFGFAGRATVFGQTYKGFDVVERLTNIPANEQGYVTEMVKIRSVTISQFKDGDEAEDFPLYVHNDTNDSETEQEILESE